MVGSTWEDRELPLLDAIGRAEERGEPVSNESLMKATGLDVRRTSLGLRALFDDGYITGADVSLHGGPGFELVGIRLLGPGRRAIGQWPSSDEGRLLIAILEQRIANVSDPAERTGLEQLRDAALGVGHEVLVSVLSAFARSTLGLP